MTWAHLTAVDVARLCHVDLKTIHNWANKGKLHGTRTEGRHLRFRRLVVVELLRTYGHSVPEALLVEPIRVCIAGDPAPMTARRALARKHDVIVVGEVMDALLSLASIDPDVLVLEDAPWLEEARAIQRLGEVADTKHLRVVVTSDDPERRDAALHAGASASVPRDVALLRAAIDRIALGYRMVTSSVPRK